MGDVNWFLCNSGGEEERKEVGLGGPSFGPPVSQKLGPREKLPFEPQSTAYSSKPCLAICLIIS